MLTVLLAITLALAGVWIRNLYDRLALAEEETFVAEAALVERARKAKTRIANLAVVALKWQARAHELADQLELSRRTTVVVMEHYEAKARNRLTDGTWLERAVAR
jgi:hypothetical protein